MNIERKFSTDRPFHEIIDQTKKYFLSQGFQLQKEDGFLIEFKRGSRLLNFITFDPLKWCSVIVVRFATDTASTHITAIFDVSTVGHIVMESESSLWYRFAEEYQKTIEIGSSIDFQNERKKIKNSVWKLMLLLGIGGGIVGALMIRIAKL